MSASPIPTREHGLQLPPPRQWVRVWTLKRGGIWERVSAEDRERIEAAEMEAAQVEKETEYWL